MPQALLADRGVVEITGEDRVAFLQGLVSNDVCRAAPDRAVWAALLTPQGKWLADFFITAGDGSLRLDCERAQAPMLLQRLGRFRLRSKVALADVSDANAVVVGWDGTPAPAGAAADPRLPEAGWRLIVSREALQDAPAAATLDPGADSAAAYDSHRLALGLPDGSRDLEAEHSVLLEAGFDELSGIAWDKGCYMGQELTARTRYRGLVKRRLVPVEVAGALPGRDAAVLLEGREVGRMRSGRGARGLALLRLEALGATALSAEDARLRPTPPRWMRLPASAA